MAMERTSARVSRQYNNQFSMSLPQKEIFCDCDLFLLIMGYIRVGVQPIHCDKENHSQSQKTNVQDANLKVTRHSFTFPFT